MISYKKLYRIFVWILFLSFMVLYVAQKGGYYEDLNNKKATLTQEKIKQFEADVKNGEEIKVENYIVNMKKNYSNKISTFGLYTSDTFAKGFKWLITSVFGGIDKMVNN